MLPCYRYIYQKDNWGVLVWYDCPMVFTHANLSLSDVNLTGFLEYEVISI